VRPVALLLALEACLLVQGRESHSDHRRESQPFFVRHQLSSDFYAEGVAVGDINRDGKMDVVAGPYWYAGPDFQKRFAIYPPVAFDPLKYSNDQLTFVYDFNHDGWPDVLVINFPGLDASWFENPGDVTTLWTKHQVIDQVGNESPAFVDINGDGVPELVYIAADGRLGWAGPDPADPTQPWIFHPISPYVNYGVFTHGLGVGDINGDGRPDILEANGWWEQPASLVGDPVWKFHPVPFGPGAQLYAVDLDGDGLKDVVASVAHSYGLFWFQQVRQDGQISFCKHVIMGDPNNPNRYGVSFSELHAVVVTDVDGDGIPDIVTGKRHWAHGPNGDVDPNGPSVLYWFKTVRTDEGVDFIPYLIDDNSGVGTQIVVDDVRDLDRDNGAGNLDAQDLGLGLVQPRRLEPGREGVDAHPGRRRPDVVISNKLGTFFMQRVGNALPHLRPQFPLNTACQP
jgi:FG-GAP-like repeat